MALPLPLQRLLVGAVATTTLLVAGPPARAQVPSSEPLVITGSREPLARQQLVGDVVVIDAERIRRSGADSLEDLLRREAGLQLLRNGGPTQSAGLSIRGGSRGQTLVLIDGVRVGAATLGTPELDALSLAGIERIEVLRGPGSSLYGADALGGVVQIFTRRAGDRPVLALRAAEGGYGAREGSVAAEARASGFDVAASVSEERLRGASAMRPDSPFDGHNPDADGHTRRTASAQVGFAPAEGQRFGLLLRGVRLDNRYDSADFPPPTFAPDASGDFHNRLRDDLVALDYRARLGEGTEAWTLSARAASEATRSVSGAAQTSRFATGRDQGSVQVSRGLGAVGRITAALEGMSERASSTEYAAPVSRRNDAAVLAYAGEPGAAVGVPALQRVAVQAEARRDRNSIYGDNTTGRLGVRWPLGEGGPDSGVSLRALVGSSFRAPSFNDLYFPGFGVATLRPEKATSTEVGIDWRGAAGAEAALTLYRQRQRDLIGFESDPARCPAGFAFGCAANVQSARLQGASVDGRLPWLAAGGGSAAARLEWLDAIDRGTGQPLPRRAKRQASVTLEQQAGPVRASAEVVHVGERPDFGAMLPAYTTLDLLATWRPGALEGLPGSKGLEVQAKLLNATDRDVQPLRGYQALGRQAWIVLRWAEMF